MLALKFRRAQNAGRKHSIEGSNGGAAMIGARWLYRLVIVIGLPT
jgi:hypothetical protein